VAKTVAIVQSNYIPWKGYFDLIRRADEFVLYDDVQYTRRDWRNRNRIKTPAGIQWLTIPVDVKGKYFQSIRETRVSDADWARNHWRTLSCAYGRAPFFRQFRERFEALYAADLGPYLSDINRAWIQELCQILGIRTTLTSSSDYRLTEEDPSERLIEICRQAGATDYLSGPAARAYMNEPAFARENIRVHYMEYSGYAEYPQLYAPFDHAVSILDLLFMTGSEATRYLERSSHAA